MGSYLLAIWCLSRAQDGQHAMAGVRVMDMDRQEAPLIVMGIEQRQLLMAMHSVCGVVDIERDHPRPSQGQAWARAGNSCTTGPPWRTSVVSSYAGSGRSPNL